tara:strand:- start:61054 stop:62001 length:948 start_codon:yes stop_codon:yes gene_type:complete
MRITRRELLINQTHNNVFSRLDIVVRNSYLNSIGTRDYKKWQKIYNKMQRIRTGHNKHTNGLPWVEQFLLLDRSFAKNGYIERYPLIVNKDLHLINSSHRASLCLHHAIDEIPIKIVDDWRQHLESKGAKSKTYFDYGIEWFEKNNFTEKEILEIVSEKHKLFESTNLYFYAMIWPPAKKYFKQIKQSINSDFDIISAKEVDMRENFETILKKIYKIDNIEEWKLNKKISSIKKSSESREIMILKIDLINTKFRSKTKFPDCKISTSAEEIKKKIRDNFQNKIKDYYYDIIIHMSDNYDHVDHIKKVLEEHKIED